MFGTNGEMLVYLGTGQKKPCCGLFRAISLKQQARDASVREAVAHSRLSRKNNQVL